MHELKEDKTEAHAMAELLVGIWLSNLFRYPVLIVSNMKKQVNPGVLWLSRLIFEHLMTLEIFNGDTYKAFNADPECIILDLNRVKGYT